MTSTPIELELVAGGRPRLVQSLRELWSFRGTILVFAERDIRVKYKQAVLGGVDNPAATFRSLPQYLAPPPRRA